MTQENCEKIAVLTSGGVESCVLLANYAEMGFAVYPLYVECGFIYEALEKRAINNYLNELNHSAIYEPVVIKTQLDNIYKDHWGYTGKNLPTTDNEHDLWIEGRNSFLLTMAALWCATNGSGKIAFGCHAPCEYHDNDALFFSKTEQGLSLGLNRKVSIQVPLINDTKADVIRKNAHLPLYWTRSCLSVNSEVHCGVCVKCVQRRKAFLEAGIQDFTKYTLHT